MSLSIRSDHDTTTALLSHRHQLTLHIFPACLLLMAVGWSIGIMLISPPTRSSRHQEFHLIYWVEDDQARFQSLASCNVDYRALACSVLCITLQVSKLIAWCSLMFATDDLPVKLRILILILPPQNNSASSAPPPCYQTHQSNAGNK